MLIHGHQGDILEVIIRLVVLADGNHDSCLLVAVVGTVLL
jgi:hypothetical protein